MWDVRFDCWLILPLPTKARMKSACVNAGHRQVFGLTGIELFLLAVASQFE